MSLNKNKQPILIIAGPTASGKTGLSVEIALRIGNAEIVNCDSVQIYTDIEIATAKPKEEEKKGVPHHLFDYVSPEVDYTAADWARDASAAISGIESRGNVAILAGGSGFYLRTLRRPLFESPPTDRSLRERLRGLVDRKGPAHLHKILSRVDPEAAEDLFPNDYPRTMRALEVYFQTGRRFSEVRTERNDPPEIAGRMHVIVLAPPRQELYEIINARAESHFEKGLVEEVRGLLDRGFDPAGNALGAHGYRRVCEYLRGERSLESAVEKTKQDVRNYSKRQLTWFRKEPGAVWFEGFGGEARIIEAVWAHAEALCGR